MIIFLGVADKEHADVLKIVESVKMQQRIVIDKLQMEQEQLEQELESLSLHEITGLGVVSDVCIETGIPDEAFYLDCPDEQLKDTVLEEFLLLDKKYEAQLEYLNLKYQNVRQ